METTPFGPIADEKYMHEALAQARRAALRNEVPVGAVVIDADGVVVSRAYNAVEQCGLQSAHAEMRAIARASKRRNDWRLDGCWLYVTLEPCTMCIGLIMLSRCAGVVYGAASPLFGGALDTIVSLPLYRRGFVRVVSGIAANEAAELLKQFFQQKRIKNLTSKEGARGT